VIKPGFTVWFTGLSGSGKSTTSQALGALLVEEGYSVVYLDGDDLRAGLSSDLDFSAAGRDEAVRRAGELALLLARQGHVAIVALVSPRAAARERVKTRHDEAGLAFGEIYLSTPLDVCEHRDPKALYRQARSGATTHFTGVSDPYEAPTAPLVRVSTEKSTPEEIAYLIRSALPR
jgi:bifunctional enzyme CysN/CysC